MRDYIHIATQYALDAADPKNKKRFGKWIRLAGKRFLNDLKRAAKKRGAPFVFSPVLACDACDFIEKLPHVEGKWDKREIELHRSDVFFVVQLFGFRNHDGSRRFSTALKAIARKNAKSTICAAIALYCQTCEGEEGPQIYSAATTYDQAAIVFKVAKRMVEMTPDLQEAFLLQPFAKAIACYSNGGTFKALHAKASTQDGLNPSCTVVDEVHAHKDHDLINVLKSAAGARRNPLFLYATTEGYENPGPWAEIRHFAQQVLEGVIAPKDCDHFLALYYSVDDTDDDFDEGAWIKANPLMESNPLLLKEIRKEAGEAKHMPGKLSEFRIKRLNRRASSATGHINLTKWRRCTGGEVPLERLAGVPCWGGLDLASTQDICSFRLVWDLDGVLYTKGWRFVPGAAVAQRTVRGLVPYQAWVETGHLIAAGDEVIDYKKLVDVVLECQQRYNIQSVGYDNWNSAQIVQELRAAGLDMQQFIQGPQSYHPAMKALDEAYLGGRLQTGDDPVLNWCASNLVARKDVNLNTAPDKKKAADKIDDMCALLMAVGRKVFTEAPTTGTIDSWLAAH